MEKNISSILLTGIPGVGKTTIIVKKLIKIFNEKHIKCIGFFTEEMRSENGIRIGFDVVDVNGKRGVLAREHPTDNIRRPHVGKYSVYTKDFEDIALPMLKIEAKTILIVDEIGKMELLTTIPNRQTIDIVEKIRSDHSSLVLEITKKNRNEIVDEIFQKINQMLTI
ncbi:nucleoside-triphosphatase THEP1 isoform X3 [Episyrphus balteatus]|uniref:nucleoside-triphosphatase THEP1 isoform X3 n=1 Tax=Episyrphus balteatus TaxID=286459 RepID=UPI00248557AE|nr:nucleoside-triphosphatase THEP1 isoform X3 [Episyrphus balteatus]